VKTAAAFAGEAYGCRRPGRVFENGKLLREKHWTERFPRDPSVSVGLFDWLI